MNEHDELLDGENVDPRDEVALREALHDQLCIDAALTARLGGHASDDRIRRSVLAALQSCGEAESQNRVMHDARLRRPRHAQQRWATGFALAAAAVIVLMGLGWWLLRAPPRESSAANQQIPTIEVPRIVQKPRPLVVAAPKPIDEPVAQTPVPAPRNEQPEPVAPMPPPPRPAPTSSPTAAIASAPPVMPRASSMRSSTATPGPGKTCSRSAIRNSASSPARRWPASSPHPQVPESVRFCHNPAALRYDGTYARHAIRC